VASLNMHGFKQGEQFLSELCDRADVVFIQEHWLQPYDCMKLNTFCDTHIGFSVSSMTDSVQSSILRGRPFGGVGMLIKKDIAVNMKCLLNTDRCIVLQIDSILFCNVYLPPAGSVRYINEG